MIVAHHLEQHVNSTTQADAVNRCRAHRSWGADYGTGLWSSEYHTKYSTTLWQPMRVYISAALMSVLDSESNNVSLNAVHRGRIETWV
jgi:hypothetical protein